MIDYTVHRPEDVIRDVDIVFDAVGGEVTDRSWSVLAKGGLLITIGDLIDAGQVRPIIESVLPLKEARAAFERGLKGHTRGKIVLVVT